jgi:DNA adenine methylase
MGLEVEKVWANDLNPDLINFFKFAQAGRVFKCKFIHSQEFYNAMRDEFNSLPPFDANGPIDDRRAALFYYLNKASFNGLWRLSKQGRMNTPIGYPSKYSSHPDRHNMIFNTQFAYSFPDFARVTRRWEFSCLDFAAMTGIGSKDFLFVDPPYYKKFVEYLSQGFPWRLQKKVAKWSSQQPCPVVATNTLDDRIVQLYLKHGFSYMQFDKNYRVSGGKKGRELKKEAVFLKLTLPKIEPLPLPITIIKEEFSGRLSPFSMSQEDYLKYVTTFNVQ